MLLRQLFDSPSCTYSYLIADSVTGYAALVDPVLEQIDRDLALASRLELRVSYILKTHVRPDHVTAAGEVRKRTGARIACGASDTSCADIQLEHGGLIHLGSLVLTALATPGHTSDGFSYRVPGHVLTGDTLLIGGCGPSDLEIGNAGELHDSITRVLYRLADETIVLPGHDYNGFTASTIGEEKRHNARVAGRSRDEFIALMADLRLRPSAPLDRAGRATRACGRLGG